MEIIGSHNWKKLEQQCGLKAKVDPAAQSMLPRVRLLFIFLLKILPCWLQPHMVAPTWSRPPLVIIECYPVPDHQHLQITLPRGFLRSSPKLPLPSYWLCPWRWGVPPSQTVLAENEGEVLKGEVRAFLLKGREKHAGTTRAGVSHRNPKHMPRASAKQEEQRWLIVKRSSSVLNMYIQKCWSHHDGKN